MTEWAYAPLRDFLPPRPSVLTWSILKECTAHAIREGYGELGYVWPPEMTLLRLAEGEPQLNLTAWRAAAQAVQRDSQAERGGLLARFFRRRPAPKTAASVAADAAEHLAAIERWQQRVQRIGNHWTQADILQVMEEVERLALALWKLSWRIEIAAEAARAALSPMDGAHLVAGLADEGAGNARLWEMVQALPKGATEEAWQPLLDAFGYRSADDLEVAAPRWWEVPPTSAATLLTVLPSPHDAEAQRKQAETGLAPDMAPRVQKARDAERLRGQARAARVRLVDATRRWALACGSEALKDGRLSQREEIFLFEIEEVKRLMTGEWNKAAQVQALVQARRQAVPSSVVRAP